MLPYLSACDDFKQIKAHVSHDVMENMEEAIRLYEETDKILVEQDGGLAHVDGDDFFVSAIEWYCGMMDTKDFISDFGKVPLSAQIETASRDANSRSLNNSRTRMMGPEL